MSLNKVDPCEGGTQTNPLTGVECLPIADNNEEQNLAQVYEICLQFELAILFKRLEMKGYFNFGSI